MCESAPQRAAAYIRVSTEDQTEFSPEAQRRALESYAAGHGYLLEPDNIFVDEGISGRTAEKRPAFLSMIARAKSRSRPFDVILVHKFDRFARSREDSVVYKSLLRRECGVRVISITESIEDDKFSIILEAMLEAMAEYYSINLSDEVKKGMAEKHRRGGLQAAPAFGYRVEDNRLVPVPPEAALVREIFRRFLRGESPYAIARRLNGLGARTHRGNPFEGRTVEYILRNPVYIGKLRWTPTGRIRRDFGCPDSVITDGPHPPLIDSGTWDAAQRRARAAPRPRETPPERRRSWMAGLLFCAACGKPLTFVRPCYWRCSGYGHGSCACSQYVRDDLLQEALLDRLQLDMGPAPALVCTPSGAGELALLPAQFERARRRLTRLREAYLDGAESPEEYRAAKKPLDAEAEGLSARIARIGENPDGQEALRAALTDTLPVLRSDAPEDQKRAAARAVIDRCLWDREARLLRIYYRPPD